MKTLFVYFNVDAFAIQLRDHITSALKDLRIEYKVCHITSFERESESFQPTMTIFFHPNELAYEYRDAIRKAKGHKLVWSMEDPWEIDLTEDIMSMGVYYCFTMDENAAKHLTRLHSKDQVYYVPHALNPRYHRPLEIEYKHRSDILFVGNAYPSRLDWLERNAPKFKNKYMTIIGVGYRGLPGYDHQNIIEGHIHQDEMLRYISGSKLVLNLHRQNEDLRMRNTTDVIPTSFNNRYYEVAAMGKRQLVVGRGEERIFKPVPLGRFRADNSYKIRLERHYLNLIK